MKKKFLIFISFIVALFIFGCSSVENVLTDDSNDEKMKITQEEIINVRKSTNPKIYQEIMNKYHGTDDRDMVIYYNKILSLNEEYYKNKCFVEYDNPRITERLYSADIKSDINKAVSKMSFKVEQDDMSLYNGCDYKFKVENFKDSPYDIEPSVFFIVRDKLTKKPVDCGRIDFDMLKPGESDEKEITLPVGELELVPNTAALLPKKLIETGLIFDTDILEDYPSKQFANKKVPHIYSGKVINDNTPKISLQKDTVRKDVFAKDTKVVVLFLDKNNRYMVSDCIGGYAYVDKNDVILDNGQELKFNPLDLGIIDLLNAVL